MSKAPEPRLPPPPRPGKEQELDAELRWKVQPPNEDGPEYEALVTPAAGAPEAAPPALAVPHAATDSGLAGATAAGLVLHLLTLPTLHRPTQKRMGRFCEGMARALEMPHLPAAHLRGCAMRNGSSCHCCIAPSTGCRQRGRHHNVRPEGPRSRRAGKEGGAPAAGTTIFFINFFMSNNTL